MLPAESDISDINGRVLASPLNGMAIAFQLWKWCDEVGAAAGLSSIRAETGGDFRADADPIPAPYTARRLLIIDICVVRVDPGR